VTARIDSLGLGDQSVDPCVVATSAAEVIAQRPVDRRTAILSLAAVLAAAGCAGDVTPGRPRSAAKSRPVTDGPTPRGTSPSATQSALAAKAQTEGPSAEPAIARSAGPDIVHGPRTRREVALTFHGAGDRSLTEQILRDCADHDARITVFAVGQWLAGTPSLGPQILADGHELGNHTWSHQQMPALSAQAAQDEIRRGADALRNATGSSGWWFRPSGTPLSTATIRAAASRSGYQRCVSYDVDPQDYRDPGAAKVVTRTLEQVRPGSIVSLHLGHVGTVQALPRILDGLAAQGLVPVTLSRLLRG
jgi:peptidoglycan/xylan/chitin deacetylase (PgdA/CDA1 family)